MPKIFLESHNLKNPYFGFGQFNIHLITSLAKLKDDHLQFTILTDDIKRDKLRWGNDFNYKKYYSRQRYKFFRIKGDYDIWHSLNQNSKIEPGSKCKLLLTVHNIIPVTDLSSIKTDSRHIRFQEKLSKADGISYISKFAKYTTQKYYDVPDVPQKVIYNGNPLSNFSFSQNIETNQNTEKPYFFSIGEITPRKNFESIIKMMKHFPDFNLIIAGKNSTNEANRLENIIQAEKLKNQVFLVGKISDHQKCLYYKNCSAFLFPSFREGFGLPVVEAMQFGKPCIISNLTSLPEIGGDACFFFENFEAKEMANRVKEALNLIDKKPKYYSEKAKNQAKKFSWDKAAKDYLDFYKLL